MSSLGETPEWLLQINKLFEEQYRRNQEPFETLISVYRESLGREEVAADEGGFLREQLERLQSNIKSLNCEVELLRANGLGVDNRKYQELESRYQSVKEERMELLRTQSQNSQKLLEMSEMLKSQQLVREKMEEEIKRLQLSTSDVDKRSSYLMQLVEEKNLNIQILQDELQALQLELLQTDERVKGLERENGQLVQRWLSKVNEAVEKLNAEVESSSPHLHPERATEEERLFRNVSKVELGQSVSGIATSASHDLIMPLCESDVHGRLCVLQKLESSRYLCAPGSMNLCQALFTNNADLCIGFGGCEVDVAHIWNAESGKRMGSLAGGLGNSFIDLAALSSTNDAIATLNSVKSLRLYDLPRAFCLWTETLDTPGASLTSLTVNNSDLLAVLSQDGRISLWDIRQRQVSRKSNHQIPKLFAVSSDPNHSSIVACTERSIVVVDPGSLKVLRTVQHSAMNFASQSATPMIAVSPCETGKYAASSRGRVFYGDFRSATVDAQISDHEYAVSGVDWIGGGVAAPLLVTADIQGTIVLREVKLDT